MLLWFYICWYYDHFSGLLVELRQKLGLTGLPHALEKHTTANWYGGGHSMLAIITSHRIKKETEELTAHREMKRLKKRLRELISVSVTFGAPHLFPLSASWQAEILARVNPAQDFLFRFSFISSFCWSVFLTS